MSNIVVLPARAHGPVPDQTRPGGALEEHLLLAVRDQLVEAAHHLDGLQHMLEEFHVLLQRYAAVHQRLAAGAGREGGN